MVAAASSISSTASLLPSALEGTAAPKGRGRKRGSRRRDWDSSWRPQLPFKACVIQPGSYHQSHCTSSLSTTGSGSVPLQPALGLIQWLPPGPAAPDSLCLDLSARQWNIATFFISWSPVNCGQSLHGPILSHVCRVPHSATRGPFIIIPTKWRPWYRSPFHLDPLLPSFFLLKHISKSLSLGFWK